MVVNSNICTYVPTNAEGKSEVTTSNANTRKDGYPSPPRVSMKWKDMQNSFTLTQLK